MYINKGSSLIEVIVVASVLTTASLAFFSSFTDLSSLHKKNTLLIKGQLLAEEGIEIVRLVRDSGWSNVSAIPTEQDYYFNLGLSAWGVTTTPEVIDGVFARHFRLHEVRRSAVNGSIVQSGGSVDANTFLADVFVSWLWNNATTTLKYQTYVIHS
jgi:hypothetical protein